MFNLEQYQTKKQLVTFKLTVNERTKEVAELEAEYFVNALSGDTIELLFGREPRFAEIVQEDGNIVRVPMKSNLDYYNECVDQLAAILATVKAETKGKKKVPFDTKEDKVAFLRNFTMSNLQEMIAQLNEENSPLEEAETGS